MPAFKNKNKLQNNKNTLKSLKAHTLEQKHTPKQQTHFEITQCAYFRTKIHS
jgi:hypothetical protein